MKLSILIAAFLASFSSFACNSSGPVCVGDIVFPDLFANDVIDGARVKAVNMTTGKFIVLSLGRNSDGRLYQYDLSDLSIPKGCLDNVCVGAHVYPDSFSNTVTAGAKVKAINHFKNKVTLISQGRNSDGKLYRLSTSGLSRTKGCLSQICVGDRVFPDNFSSNLVDGAKVLAINYQTKTFTVISDGQNGDKKLYRYLANRLFIIFECNDYTEAERNNSN